MAETDYFDLTAGDENADGNLQRFLPGDDGMLARGKPIAGAEKKAQNPGVAAQRGTPTGKATNGSKASGKLSRPASPGQMAGQACLRAEGAFKPLTPSKSLSGSVVLELEFSPAVRSLHMTPGRGSDIENIYSGLSPAVSDSIGQSSVGSLLSLGAPVGSSRLTQLSRRTKTNRQMSTAELELQQIEEKRRQQREMVRKNDVNCRKAISKVDAGHGSTGTGNRSVNVTVSEDLNLSRGNISVCASDAGNSDHESESAASDWSQSLRPKAKRTSVGGSSTANPGLEAKWKPKLTVPEGPQLRTARRKSISRESSVNSEPERSKGALAVRREQAAMDRQAAAARRQAAGSRTSTPQRSRPATPQKSRPATPQSSRPATPQRASAARPATPQQSRVAEPANAADSQDRAAEARRVAQQKYDSRGASATAFGFKKPSSSTVAGKAAPTPAVPARQPKTDPTSSNQPLLSARGVRPRPTEPPLSARSGRTTPLRSRPTTPQREGPGFGSAKSRFA